MSKNKSNRISTFGSQLTSVVSVTLVLLILGVLGVIGVAGHEGMDMLKQNLGFIIKIERTAPENDINRLKKWFSAADYVSNYVYSSADEILATETEYLGEDIAALVDVNPYGAEFDVKVKPEYANLDSIEAISSRLRAYPSVEDVLTESTMIANLDTALSRISWILIAIAAALLAISVVLINNTVHLAVYSRRFVIHTMKLVGATAAFIRRPFIIAGAVSGLIAAALASIILTLCAVYGASVDPMLGEMFTPSLYICVIASLFIIGILICTISSFVATTRYIRLNYDDMFMK